MVHYYDIWTVSEIEYELIILGSEYKGGKVIEGIWCEETGEYLIITLHYENECPACHSTGFVEYEVGFIESCDQCDGTGSIE
jgi:hypothetical protein